MSNCTALKKKMANLCVEAIRELMRDEMSKETAVAIHDSGAWRKLGIVERAKLQLQQPRLCMPFSEFHKAVEQSIGRPVWTHEFIEPKSLLAEIEPCNKRATLADVLGKLPTDKTVVCVHT